MGNALRAAAVLASVVVAAASATAPARHKVETTTTVPASVDQAWEAMIDLFADNNWAIQNLDRSSGLITTDWMSLGRDGDEYADGGPPRDQDQVACERASSAPGRAGAAGGRAPARRVSPVRARSLLLGFPDGANGGLLRAGQG